LLHRWYGQLLHLRPRVVSGTPEACVAFEARGVLLVRCHERAWMAYCFAAEPCQITLPVPAGHWQVLLCSADSEWEGPGTSMAAQLESLGELHLRLQPHSFVCCGRPDAD
jgi:hypothetical protein